MKGHLIGPLLITLTNQGSGAPLVDHCFSTAEKRPGVVFGGWAILLKPWRRNRWGEHGGGLALVIGWAGFRPRQRLPIRGTTLEMSCSDEVGEAPKR